jgi:hypothetical protein
VKDSGCAAELWQNLGHLNAGRSRSVRLSDNVSEHAAWYIGSYQIPGYLELPPLVHGSPPLRDERLGDEGAYASGNLSCRDPGVRAIYVCEPEMLRLLEASPYLMQTLERVMNLDENRIEMRIPQLAWFPRDLCFPHS